MLDLKLELQKALGSYDGSRVHYHPTGFADSMVHYHETTHARIMNETCDGFILRMLMLFHSHEKTDTIPNLSDIIARAIDRSRFAHEAAATYIGIKFLGTKAERERAVSSLSRPYRRYYDYFGSMIDPLVSSSYLQADIAWAVTCFVFSSTSLRRIVEDPASIERLWENDGPDLRAAQLREWLCTGNLNAAINYCYQQYRKSAARYEVDPRSLESLNTEDVWAAMSKKEIAFVEDTLMGSCYDYLVEHGPVESLDAANKRVFGQKLVESLKLDVTIGEVTPASLEDGTTFEALQALAFVQIANVVHNLNKITRVQNEFTTISFPGINHNLAICFDRTAPLENGCFVERHINDTTEVEILHCKGETAVEIIKSARKRRSGVSALRILAPSTGATLKASPLYRRISSGDRLTSILGSAIGPRKRPSHNEAIVWYEHDWWQLLLNRKHYRIWLGVLSVTLDDLPAENRRFILNIARVRGITGILIKALPPTITEVVLDYYNELYQRGEVFRLADLKDYAEICAGGYAGLRQAVLFWDEL